MRAKLAVVAAFALASTLVQAQSGPEQIYRAGTPGISEPVLVRQEAPSYPSAAQRAGVQGAVELEAVVLANGTVGDVRVTRSLDTQYGLDAEAMRVARRWLFRPGQLNGTPVPFMVTMVIEFRAYPGAPPAAAVRAAERAAQAAAQAQEDEFTKGTYRHDAPGVVAPKAVKQVVPKYTSGAMRAKIQGRVVVEAVVGIDGKVDRARIKESLDQEYGLDYSALDAARQWEFEPGTFEGKPAPVLVILTLEFRLHE